MFYRIEVDIILVGRGFIQLHQQIKLRYKPSKGNDDTDAICVRRGSKEERRETKEEG